LSFGGDYRPRAALPLALGFAYIALSALKRNPQGRPWQSYTFRICTVKYFMP